MNIFLNPEGNKIGVEFPYNATMVAQVRSIPGARWLPARKHWSLNKDMPTYEALVTSFPYLEWDEKIHEWAKKFRQVEETNLIVKDAPANLPVGFKTKPFDHQMKALELVARNHNYALCMEMGTGKSAVMVYHLSELKRAGELKRALIVAPLSVVYNWKAEIEKHADNLTVSVVAGDKMEKHLALDQAADVYVTNYASLRMMVGLFTRREWDVMICDESQNIKNRTSQQAKAAYLIGKQAKRRYILTGTLVTNKPLDVFGQFKFLDEAILGHNFFAFQSRYAIMRTQGKAQFPVAFRNLQELSEKLAPWSYRVLKSECLDLPDKIYETRHTEMSEEQWRIYKELGRELMVELREGDRVVAPIILTKLLRFSQLTSGFIVTASGETREVGRGEKIKELLQLLDESSAKFVVWTKFKKEMEMVKRALRERGIEHVSLSGDDKLEDRQQAIERFSVMPDIRVFVGSIEAGGTGINLTAASVVVYMSNSYSLGTRMQSEDRCHRIGQKNNVTYIDLVVPGSIDEKIVKMLKGKQDLAQLVQGDKQAEIVEELLSV